MAAFESRAGQLFAEGVSLAAIASTYGTPCYVYSRAALERNWRAFDEALGGYPHLVCYAVKANGNLAVLDVLARLGSGFDIVSGGELERVLAARGDPGKCIYSGVGKSEAEIRRALGAGVRCFNVESAAELERLAGVAAALGAKARIAIRVNPDVDPQTHPYISTGLLEHKFGVPMADAVALYQRASDLSHLQVEGVACHIGSQLTSLSPYVDTVRRLLELVDALAERGIATATLNVGGGLGIRYRDETPPTAGAFAETLKRALEGRSLALHVEPGRSIVGNAGVLLTRVEYLKRNASKRFAVVDAAMNDFLRPALYAGWHDIVPVAARREGGEAEIHDVVGPVCESSDFLGKERPLAVAAGDLLAVMNAGAYAFCMSSNYNARPRAAEVLVDGEVVYLVRRREEVQDLLRGESCLPP